MTIDNKGLLKEFGLKC